MSYIGNTNCKQKGGSKMTVKSIRFTPEMDKLIEAVRVIINLKEEREGKERITQSTEVLRYLLEKSYIEEVAKKVSEECIDGMWKILKQHSSNECYGEILLFLKEKLINLSVYNKSLPTIEVNEIITTLEFYDILPSRHQDNLSIVIDKACTHQFKDKHMKYKLIYGSLVNDLLDKYHEESVIAMFDKLRSILDEYSIDDCLEMNRVL